jgi:hypothetical protein
MVRTKLEFKSENYMFGTDVYMVDENRKDQCGFNLGYDPIAKLTPELNKGYLFRNPKASPELISTIWHTVENLTGAVNVWTEAEREGDKDTQLISYVRIAEQGDATMFAFSHNEFEKWDDVKEKADAKARKAASKPLKVHVTKDGRIRAKVSVETLGD